MIAKSWLSRCWWLGRYFLAIGGAITFVGDCAFAQSKIVPDSTLGKESSVVIPNSNNLPVEVIRGGAKRGANLFQSFQEFNVLEGGGAYFYSPSADIQNIVARVTGSHHSEILGTLGTIGNSNPNLFLINPNGIIFGPNASLNIGASFIATTANAIKFGNQGVFNASAPNVPPLLTVNPSAFLFNQIAQPITNLSPEGLHIPEGQSFLLLGGNVSFDGAVVVAPGGRVELGGLAGAGTVGLNVDGSDLHLIFPEGVTRADVSLRNGARIDVSAGGGGNLAINARNLDVLEGSELRAGIGSRLGSVDSKAGDIEINAAGTITLNDGSFISNVVSMSAVGKGGNVNITAGSLSMSNGALVNTNTFGQGNSGEIHIQAGSLSLTDGSQLRADTAGQGNAGSISVRVGGAISLVGDDSAIYSLVEPTGSGNGGNIDILAGSLSLQGYLSSTKIAQISNSTYGGNTGNIHIQAGSLSLANDALLSSETYGQGNAGNILIEVDNAVSLTNYSFILNGLRPGAMGNGGKIDIHARSLTVTDSALSASTNNNTQGKAGNIEINADDFVKISGVIPGSGASAGLFTTAEDTGKGGAGDIIVNTNALSISNGAVLSARTRNSYSGGNITVNVKTLEATNGGQLFSTASSSGRAGDITINAASSIILSGSDPTYADRVAGFGLSNPISENSAQVDTDGSASGLFARSTGQGNAGNISVTVRRGNLQANNGNILTNATQSGGGNVDITARDIRLRNNSAIKTNSGGSNGGNIFLNAKTIVALEDSDILSFAPKGLGGNITFNTRAFLSSPLYRPTPPITDLATLNALEKPNGRVDVNASGAVSGVISGVPDISFLQNSLTELPTNLIDTNNLIANSCIARNPQQKGSFIITGAGGLPSQPDDPANAPFPTYVVPAVGAFTSLPSSVSSTNSARPWKKGDPIVEPQGVYRLPDGHLVLSRKCRQ